ncbi:hypothetical protein T552_00851 [Pneumocystis carinii B80]|uniref:Major surface glycoprotein 2 C-terminal domain-containing protein n=1 Tax=Pneumocystis carinii (strain B80) TaxID=1408658 RepID=A0A0W4ZPS6_PNEC8|nr:hypothetical protein T552_00851 [Pneumocystis carinii B80]KTW30378.1 hypothetical protein T552_00851 [Pneumocystis carinii B80]
MFFSIINKIIVLGILILIVPTYGNQSTHLKARDSQVRTVNTPFKDFVVKEEKILAYILKEDYKDENKCKSKLNEYCKELKGIDKELNKVHSKVKEICGDIDKKCKDLKEKVEKELKVFEDELYPLKLGAYEGNCEKHQEKCILLEEISHNDLKEKCVKLREECYRFKREKVAEELLFRALGKDIRNGKDGLEDNFKCKEKMEKICPILSRESDELMDFCLRPTNNCAYLKRKMEDICELLKTKLNENVLKEKCYERLEKCHFYKACENTKCEEDKEQCEEKNITYKAPGSDSSPVEPEPSLLTRIGLEDVYKRAEKDGIFIGRQGVDLPRRFGGDLLQDLLLVLSRYERQKEPKKKCDEALRKCSDSKYLDTSLKELCDDGKKEEKCKELLNVEERCTNLKLNLYLKDLSTGYEKADSELLFWRQLPTLFTKGECVEFESECFYLKNVCKDNKIDKACQNVRVACHKMGKDRMLNMLFREGLKGELDHIRYYNNPEKCQKFVVEECRKLDKKYLPKCLYPKELCYAVSDDIFLQSKELGVLLDDQRDFPLEKDCIKLKEDCEGILKDLGLNNGKCVTLKERCEYFKVTRELKYAFLKEKSDALADNEKCMKALKDKCDKLPKVMGGGGGLYHVSCALPEETCKFMVSEAKNHCNIFKKNLEKHEIVNKTKDSNETLVGETCMLWDPYCDQLMENCPETLKNDSSSADGKGVCLQLKENCKPFWEKKRLEDELAYLLRGNLGDVSKCKETLGKYCTEWKAVSNETFNALLGNCNDTTKVDVCEKLVEKVQKICSTLKTDMVKLEELENKKYEYEEAELVAKEFTKAAKLLLSKPGQAVTPSAQNSSGSLPAQPPPPPQDETSDTSSGTPNTQGETTKNAKLGLVKRAYVAEELPEAELKAFNATMIALELYLELKEECEPLELNCNFRKDCSDSKKICRKIDTLCKLEPLEITPHHTEKITVTITETKTITMTIATTTIVNSIGGEVIRQCTLLRIMDTWVTNTITNTSIVTSTLMSTVTSTSMRRCQPTECIIDSNKETDKGGLEEVIPGEGMKIRVPDMIKIMLLGVIVMGMM